MQDGFVVPSSDYTVHVYNITSHCHANGIPLSCVVYDENGTIVDGYYHTGDIKKYNNSEIEEYLRNMQ